MEFKKETRSEEKKERTNKKTLSTAWKCSTGSCDFDREQHQSLLLTIVFLVTLHKGQDNRHCADVSYQMATSLAMQRMAYNVTDWKSLARHLTRFSTSVTLCIRHADIFYWIYVCGCVYICVCMSVYMVNDLNKTRYYTIFFFFLIYLFLSFGLAKSFWTLKLEAIFPPIKTHDSDKVICRKCKNDCFFFIYFLFHCLFFFSLFFSFVWLFRLL